MIMKSDKNDVYLFEKCKYHASIHIQLYNAIFKDFVDDIKCVSKHYDEPYLRLIL